jgi:hypothetical protein
VQRIDGALKMMHGLDQRADHGALGVKLRVAAIEVILDQFLDVALMELIGEPLPGLEIEPSLIEPAPESLPILRDETGDEASGHHRAYQQQSVEQAAKK